MKKQLMLLLLVVLGAAACTTIKTTGAESFGETITAKDVISYEKLLKKMDAAEASLEAKVVGEVSAVCQMKGCWINMTTGDPGDPEMFVKFKDYGFFLPKDIAGRKVVMEGTAFREITSVEELRHMAEDAGKSKEEIAKITDPKEELKFVASGVLLLPE